MGCTVLAHGDTRMGCADLYVQMRVADRITNLLEVTSRRKHGKGTDKRYLATGSKTCRNTCHITFCNTAVYMTVRKRL